MMQNALASAPWLSAMARVFDRAGAPLYLVGGGVRNPLLGLPVSDADVCGPLLPHEVCALCESTPVRARIRAAAFGTVELYVHDENGAEQMAEYTAWREDCYTSGHRPDSVRFTADISVDACRRDFSVNALYQRLHDGWMEDVTDPTGGLAHLRAGVLHTATADPDRILCHDGQRILRAARFQAEMDLVPTPAMMDSLCRNAGLIRELSAEQLRAETEKILMADLRYPMLRRRHPATASGLETLHRIGAWAYLFPDVDYDPSAVAALERLEGTLPQRMALLCHSAVPETVHTAMQRMRFSARETALAVGYAEALCRVREADLCGLAELGLDAAQTARRIYAALNDSAGTAQAALMLQRLQGRPLCVRELAVNGNDLKPLLAEAGRPLRDMGGLLQQLWKAVLEEGLPNEREALLQGARRQL